MPETTTLPILSARRRTPGRSILDRSISMLSSTSSNYQGPLSSSLSNHSAPSHLHLKSLKPEQWQRLFSEKHQPKLMGQPTKSNIGGLVPRDSLSVRNRISIDDENSQNSSVATSTTPHFDHLYEQMNEITIQLAEERFKHKQTRTKAEESLITKLEEQKQIFQELQHHQLLEHKKKLKEQEKEWLAVLNEEKTQGLKREEQLRSELEFLKQSFHTYKTTLEGENARMLQIKVTEALAIMNKDRIRKEDVDKKIYEAIVNERKTNDLRQTKERELLQKQYQKEIESLQKKLFDSITDREKLERAYEELRSTKSELAEAKENSIDLTTQLNNLRIQYDQLMREFNEHRLLCQEKSKKS